MPIAFGVDPVLTESAATESSPELETAKMVTLGLLRPTAYRIFRALPPPQPLMAPSASVTLKASQPILEVLSPYVLGQQSTK